MQAYVPLPPTPAAGPGPHSGAYPVRIPNWRVGSRDQAFRGFRLARLAAGPHPVGSRDLGFRPFLRT